MAQSSFQPLTNRRGGLPPSGCCGSVRLNCPDRRSRPFESARPAGPFNKSSLKLLGVLEFSESFDTEAWKNLFMQFSCRAARLGLNNTTTRVLTGKLLPCFVASGLLR